MITNRRELIDYCLRALGSPVIEINVADVQVEDRIDDALDMYWQYHGDGQMAQYMSIQVDEDLLKNKFFDLPPGVMGVTGLFPVGNTFNKLSLSYQALITDIFNIRRFRNFGVHGFEIAQSYLKMLEGMFTKERRIRFNKHMRRVFLDGDLSDLKLGDYLIVEASVPVPPSESLWGDIWLKHYAVALVKWQWGNNLRKYQDFQLPSGTTLNGEQIYQDALQEIEKLEDELKNTWQLPVDFYMG